MIARMVQDTKVDERRIFVTGFPPAAP